MRGAGKRLQAHGKAQLNFGTGIIKMHGGERIIGQFGNFARACIRVKAQGFGGRIAAA